MTITIKGNAQGGVIEANGAPAANVSSASGLPFMKNILINGNLAINQRGVTIAAAANGAYGPDRWKKVDASNMTQIVEAGNFRPSTQYVLSGTGVTTQVLTSPASGNWTIPNIPITATNIQLEEGGVPTPFEIRNVGLELSLCQRYYQNGGAGWSGMESEATSFSMSIGFPSMRVAPACTLLSTNVAVRIPSLNLDRTMVGCAIAVAATTYLGAWVIIINEGGNVVGRFIQDRGSSGIFALSAEL